MSIAFWRAAAATLLLGVTACASVPLESGRANVQQLLQSRSGNPLALDGGASAQSVQQWLREPLQLPTAVRIALVRNPMLQLQLSRLGLGAADAFEATRLGNPGLNFAVLFPTGGASGNKLTAGITLGFSDLLLRPLRTRIADSEYRRVQSQVAGSILGLALDVQRAWFESVGAAQRADVRHGILQSTQAAAELAGRFHEAGNIDALALQLQGAAASEARIAAAQADGDAAEARARLQNLLGLGPGENSWTVPAELPVPVASTIDVPRLQALSLQQRLDLAAAHAQVTAAEQQADAARRFRYFSPVGLGVAAEREADGSSRVGPSLSLSLPLFNQGQGAVARAQAQLDGARATESMLAAQVASEVQLQAARMQSASEQAFAYRDALIPQREEVVTRLQEQVNFMLNDTFSLLLARQQEFNAYLGYVDSVQRYWMARVELTRAVGTRLPADAQPTERPAQEQP